MLTLISDPIKFVRPLVLYESVMLLASDHTCNFGSAGAMLLPHFYFNVVIEYESAGLGFPIAASNAAVGSASRQETLCGFRLRRCPDLGTRWLVLWRGGVRGPLESLESFGVFRYL